MHQALYPRSLQGCFTIYGDRSSWSLSKMKVNGTAFILYIFCCSGHFSMWKCIFLGISLMCYMQRQLKDTMHLVLLYCLLKNSFCVCVCIVLLLFFFFLYENVTSLGWTLNSGSDLAFTGILFVFFNGNNTVFVQFRHSTFCRTTIPRDVLLVLFAVTPIWCTCCLPSASTTLANTIMTVM